MCTPGAAVWSAAPDLLLPHAPTTMNTTAHPLASTASSREIPGVILLEAYFQCVLVGIVFTQAVKYWEDFGDDSRTKRGFVALVVALSM